MLREKHAGDLHEALKARIGDAVVSVSIGNIADRATWRVDYVPNISDDQKRKAEAAVAAWSSDGLVDDTPADETAELRQKVAKLEKFIDALSSEAAKKLGG